MTKPRELTKEEREAYLRWYDGLNIPRFGSTQLVYQAFIAGLDYQQKRIAELEADFEIVEESNLANIDIALVRLQETIKLHQQCREFAEEIVGNEECYNPEKLRKAQQFLSSQPEKENP